MRLGRRTTSIILAGLVCFGLGAIALAQQPGDEVGYGRTITVPAGETHGDITCFDCTVYVRGTVAGDVAVFGGQAVIEGTITGDVAVFWGDIRLGDGAHIGGDADALGGSVKRSPTAAVKGDAVSFGRGTFMAGSILGLAITAALVFLFIWLLIWLFRRNRTVPMQPVAQRPTR